MKNSAEKYRYDTFVVALPYVLIFCLTLFVYLVHLRYDGRTFLDHDLYYLSDFSLNTTLSPPQDVPLGDIPHLLNEFWRNSRLVGRLPNIMLFFINLLYPLNLWMLRLVNLPLFALLIYGAYRLGQTVVDNQAGLLCAVLAATLPVFSTISHTFLPHFPALVFLLWTYVAVLKIIENPLRKRYYLLLGFCSGTAILCHPIVLLQGVPLFVFPLVSLWKKNEWRALLNWGAALTLMLLMNLATWRDIIGYIAEKSANMHTTGAFRLLLDVQAHNLLIAGVWLKNIIHHVFLLPSFEILLAVASIVAVGWWLRERKFAFSWLFLLVSAVWLFIVGTTQVMIRSEGAHYFDLIGAFALLGFLPVLGLYQLIVRHRLQRIFKPLLIAAVLLVGTWQQADMLKVVSAEDPRIMRESRSNICLSKDWLWQTVEHLQHLGAKDQAAIEMSAYFIGANGAPGEKIDHVGTLKELISVASLFSLHLDPPLADRKIIYNLPTIRARKIADTQKSFSLSMYLFDEPLDVPGKVQFLRRLGEKADSRIWLDNRFQTSFLMKQFALVAITDKTPSSD